MGDSAMSIKCCSKQAVYHCCVDLKAVGVEEKYERDYCEEHIGYLIEGVARVIDKPEFDGTKLHEVFEVEHIK